MLELLEMTEKEKKVLDTIREEETISRIALAKKLSWNPATIGSLVKSLLKKEKIQEVTFSPSSGGRRARLLSLKEDRRANILALSFAPSFIQISIGNRQGKIFKTEKIALAELKKEGITKENLWTWAKEKVQKTLEQQKEIEKISVLMNGLVDNKEGLSLFSPHYQWKQTPIKEELEKLTGRSTVVENDVRAMALLEKMFGLCKSNKNFVILNIGDGVGSSIFIQNMLYCGSHLSSGELGHMVVNPKSLRRCSCGKVGCLETEVSNPSILYKLMSRIKLGQYSILKQKLEREEELKIEDFLRALEEKDVLALQVAEEVVLMIVKAVDAIVSVINPEKLVFYGKLFQNKHLYQKIQKELKTIFMMEKACNIELSHFYEEAYLYAPFALVRYLSCKL